MQCLEAHKKSSGVIYSIVTAYIRDLRWQFVSKQTLDEFICIHYVACNHMDVEDIMFARRVCC